MKSLQAQPITKTLQSKIDGKTKPLGALGLLEKTALRIGELQNSLEPEIQKPAIVLFAGDHGVADSGVSAYPKEVTYQMVLNIAAGGAAINVFARQHDIRLVTVDAGVDFDFAPELNIVHKKIGRGTKNFSIEPAMNDGQLRKAMAVGAEIVQNLHSTGCNTVGFGEMGIANTTAASALVSALTDMTPEESVGLGTGIDEKTLKRKREVVAAGVAKYLTDTDPLAALGSFAGFEMAMMAGAMTRAAALGMLVLVDGFIVSSVFLAAAMIEPKLKDCSVFCHRSQEQGHRKLLSILEAEPLLDLKLRLGEGTGCALAMPIIQSALLFLKDMASFGEAGVSDKDGN